MDKHAPFRELLAARLDRPLTRVELRSLNAHLKKCEGCTRVDTEYRDQRSRFRSLGQPIPPRDMWARTSAALDREVARGTRAAWGRRVSRARRRAQPSSALMTTVAALGVITALTVFQLAPTFAPSSAQPGRPTPFAVPPQALAFVGLGATDLAVYQMTVSEVCPQSTTLDCVPAHKIVRTPIGLDLFSSLQTGNAALSPTGRQLALVGKQSNGDVIAVVLMPTEGGIASIPTESVDSPEPTETPSDTPLPQTPAPTPTPESTETPATTPDGTESTPSPEPTPTVEGSSPPPTAEPTPTPTVESTPDPTSEPSPQTTTSPPPSAVPGLAVVSILEDVRSAGSPPAWSRNGSMLAFSAMPSDGSHGPDVYVWSPEEAHARAITSDHASHFASWSGNRIVVSRLAANSTGEVVARNFVIDPVTLEERRAGGGQIWLPSVNRQRTFAVVWRGALGLVDDRPELQSGGLFLMDWSAVDPFASSEPADDESNSAQTSEEDAPVSPSIPAATPDVGDDGSPSLELVALNPERDMSAAPVTDWQAGWSPDGQVLGIWIADSPGSNWGRLTVLAIDPVAGDVVGDEPLLGTTLARRGFSLGSDRIAWVAPTQDNVEGELRIDTWTSDGVGRLRVLSPGQEEVLPAF